jgi:hypothetical protein
VDFNLNQRVKSATLEATVILRDGTRIPLGVIAAYQEDARRFMQLLKQLGGRIRRIRFLGPLNHG